MEKCIFLYLSHTHKHSVNLLSPSLYLKYCWEHGIGEHVVTGGRDPFQRDHLRFQNDVDSFERTENLNQALINHKFICIVEPILYSNLLYKMGNYFLDRRYNKSKWKKKSQLFGLPTLFFNGDNHWYFFL